MNFEQQQLQTFVELHASRLLRQDTSVSPPPGKSGIRGAYLAQFSLTGISLNVPLTFYTVDKIMLGDGALNTSSGLVRWLLQQIKTYNPEKQVILGLIFDESTVLSHVLLRGTEQKVEEEDG